MALPETQIILWQTNAFYRLAFFERFRQLDKRKNYVINFTRTQVISINALQFHYVFHDFPDGIFGIKINLHIQAKCLRTLPAALYHFINNVFLSKPIQSISYEINEISDFLTLVVIFRKSCSKCRTKSIHKTLSWIRRRI